MTQLFSRRNAAIALGLCSTILLGACGENVSYSTTRDVQGIRGTNALGQQFQTNVTITYEGEARSKLIGNQWVDARHQNTAENQSSGFPVMTTIVRNRLQTTEGTDAETTKAAIQQELIQAVSQFNNETIFEGLLAQAPEGAVTSYINLSETAEANWQAFLVGKESTYDLNTASISGTDSENGGRGDGFITASVVDPEATKKYGRTIYQFFSCPAKALAGSCKPNPTKTNEQFLDNEGLTIPGGSVPIITPQTQQ